MSVRRRQGIGPRAGAIGAIQRIAPACERRRTPRAGYPMRFRRQEEAA